MAEWWYTRPVHSIFLVIIALHLIAYVHHWVIIYLKLRIYRVTVAYLKAAEEEQTKMDGILEQIAVLLPIIKQYLELVRIQSKTARELKDQVDSQVAANTERLEGKIDEVPDKVGNKVEKIIHESGAFPKTSGDK